jgi:hypothetical protein
MSDMKFVCPNCGPFKESTCPNCGPFKESTVYLTYPAQADCPTCKTRVFEEDKGIMEFSSSEHHRDWKELQALKEENATLKAENKRLLRSNIGLMQLYLLVKEFSLMECRCHESYTSRDMKDPSCEYHDTWIHFEPVMEDIKAKAKEAGE